jgi:hypothetical protein
MVGRNWWGGTGGAELVGPASVPALTRSAKGVPTLRSSAGTEAGSTIHFSRHSKGIGK